MWTSSFAGWNLLGRPSGQLDGWLTGLKLGLVNALLVIRGIETFRIALSSRNHGHVDIPPALPDRIDEPHRALINGDGPAQALPQTC